RPNAVLYKPTHLKRGSLHHLHPDLTQNNNSLPTWPMGASKNFEPMAQAFIVRVSQGATKGSYP
ncbi:MAG TPA: hypothetical protein PKD45_12095, partial [Flavobacteriales bacterium]|nr:hypothetical protein [Flavobacteriales bacterium]